MSEAKTIRVYGLEPVGVEQVDLRTCHAFYPPNRPMNDLFPNERLMAFSPHFEICELYLKRGLDWLLRNYRDTKYWEMMQRMGKKNFPQKVVDLCESMKAGYRREGFGSSFVVVLMEPFSASRYGRNVPNRTPEIWSGHHRTGAMLALGHNLVDVLIARDAKPGSKFSVGKVHGLCLEGDNG